MRFVAGRPTILTTGAWRTALVGLARFREAARRTRPGYCPARVVPEASLPAACPVLVRLLPSSSVMVSLSVKANRSSPKQHSRFRALPCQGCAPCFCQGPPCQVCPCKRGGQSGDPRTAMRRQGLTILIKQADPSVQPYLSKTGQPRQGRPPGSARGGPGASLTSQCPRPIQVRFILVCEGQSELPKTAPEPVPFVVLLYEGPIETFPPRPPQLFPIKAGAFMKTPLVELCLSRPASLPQGSSAVLPRQGRPAGFASPLLPRCVLLPRTAHVAPPGSSTSYPTLLLRVSAPPTAGRPCPANRKSSHGSVPFHPASPLLISTFRHPSLRRPIGAPQNSTRAGTFRRPSL